MLHLRIDSALGCWKWYLLLLKLCLVGSGQCGSNMQQVNCGCALVARLVFSAIQGDFLPQRNLLFINYITLPTRFHGWDYVQFPHPILNMRVLNWNECCKLCLKEALQNMVSIDLQLTVWVGKGSRMNLYIRVHSTIWLCHLCNVVIDAGYCLDLKTWTFVVLNTSSCVWMYHITYISLSYNV